MQRITVQVDKPFLYGGKVRQAGERVSLEASTANDLVRRHRATVVDPDAPQAPIQAAPGRQRQKRG